MRSVSRQEARDSFKALQILRSLSPQSLPGPEMGEIDRYPEPTVPLGEVWWKDSNEPHSGCTLYNVLPLAHVESHTVFTYKRRDYSWEWVVSSSSESHSNDSNEYVCQHIHALHSSI